jgi:hypothetical protein
LSLWSFLFLRVWPVGCVWTPYVLNWDTEFHLRKFYA